MADQDTIAGGNPNPRTPYKEGNTDADGNYIVGKGRTPDAGKFRKGDKRKRGRRPKSTANLDTDVMDEAKARITVNEGGKAVVITKQQAMVKRMFDKAFSGDVAAMRQAFDMIQKIGDRKAQERGHKLPQNDRKIRRAVFGRSCSVAW